MAPRPDADAVRAAGYGAHGMNALTEVRWPFWLALSLTALLAVECAL